MVSRPCQFKRWTARCRPSRAPFFKEDVRSFLLRTKVTSIQERQMVGLLETLGTQSEWTFLTCGGDALRQDACMETGANRR